MTTRSTLMDESWLGRPLSRELLPDLERLGVDPCGERGEYHTAVTSTPSLFSSRCDFVAMATSSVPAVGLWMWV